MVPWPGRLSSIADIVPRGGLRFHPCVFPSLRLGGLLVLSDLIVVPRDGFRFHPRLSRSFGVGRSFVLGLLRRRDVRLCVGLSLSRRVRYRLGAEVGLDLRPDLGLGLGLDLRSFGLDLGLGFGFNPRPVGVCLGLSVLLNRRAGVVSSPVGFTGGAVTPWSPTSPKSLNCLAAT